MRVGCEALVHTAHAFLEQDDEQLCLVQEDFINTFNMADRGIALAEVNKFFPEVSHLVDSCYGVAAKVIYGDNVILSTCGFHQGDIVATILFSLLLNPVVLKIPEEVLSLHLNGWILDDGAPRGNVVAVTRAIRNLLAEGACHGLKFSTEFTIPSDSKSTV